MVLYVPGTEETDPKKQNMSLQQIGGATTTAIANIATNTTNIATNTAAISTLQGNRVGRVIKQVFTSSGTYTPTTGMLYCIIECVGSGGGGGGANSASATESYGGGGGGSGGYSRLLASAATIGASQTVTVGALGAAGAAGSNNGAAGADVSVGSLCIGKGGAGGLFASTSQAPTGGAGGVAGTGDIASAGMSGGSGFIIRNNTVFLPSGFGGNSCFGGAAAGTQANAAASNTGIAASAYGSGGAGGIVNTSVGTAAGGNGSKGVVFITEYVIA